MASTALVVNFDMDVHTLAVWEGYGLAETVRTLPGKGMYAQLPLETEEACRAWLANGIVELIASAVAAAPRDARKELLKNIVVAGVNSHLVDSGNWGLLRQMVTEMVPGAGQMTVKVIAAQERKYYSWIGGSILGSLSTMYSVHRTHSVHLGTRHTQYVSRARHTAYKATGGGASLGQMGIWPWPAPVQPGASWPGRK